MNIFFLDRDPIVAAQYHNDKHCVKMILESAQLLSTAHRSLDGSLDGVLYDERNDVLYKRTHTNHPSAVWARRESANYRWLYDLLYALIGEYRYRYGRQHATERLLPFLSKTPFNIVSTNTEMVDPPQCMPDDSKAIDTVTAYRTYYAKHKYHIAKWTRRNTPEWWNDTIQRIHSGK